MWWLINAEGEKVFAVSSEKEAKAKLNDWYISYKYIG